MFDKKKEAKSPPMIRTAPGGFEAGDAERAASGAAPTIRHVTTLDRLLAIQKEKEFLVQKLNQELVDLDTQIAWIKRFPQVEQIIEGLRKTIG